jgi:hypothetical protein
VLDVHPPHKPMHGVSEFFLHLFTITIGLLIALSLEGAMEWQHHRHLVHEAEASLRSEIARNSGGLAETLADVHKQQQVLKDDIVVLRYIEKNHKAPEHSSLEINFRIRTFEDVSWRTAQTTGALAYMPYAEAEKYSGIYGMQTMLTAAESQAARDAVTGLGPIMSTPDEDRDGDKDPTGGRAAELRTHIETLQGQLLLVDSFMTGLDKGYKEFLKQHPE